MAASSTETDPSRSIGRGAVAGAGAYLLGYLVTYLWQFQEIREALGPINVIAQFFGSDPIPAWKVIGWLYYNAHFVATKVTFGLTGPQFVNLIRASERSLEPLYLVPPLVLLGAGAAVTLGRSDVSTWAEAAKTGALVTVGYLGAAVIGTFVFRIEGSGPDLIPAILLAGAVYPLVFGALGGSVVYGIRER